MSSFHLVGLAVVLVVVFIFAQCGNREAQGYINSEIEKTKDCLSGCLVFFAAVIVSVIGMFFIGSFVESLPYGRQSFYGLIVLIITLVILNLSFHKLYPKPDPELNTDEKEKSSFGCIVIIALGLASIIGILSIIAEAVGYIFK